MVSWAPQLHPSPGLAHLTKPEATIHPRRTGARLTPNQQERAPN